MTFKQRLLTALKHRSRFMLLGVFGSFGCMPRDGIVYTKSGVLRVDEITEGQTLLDGQVQGLHTFIDDVYEVKIGNIKFRANGEHPLWVAKFNKGLPNHEQWMSIRDISQWQKAHKSKQYLRVRLLNANNFDFETKSVGLSKAKLYGYLMSDGTWSKNQSVKFTNTNPIFIKEVEDISHKLGLVTKRYPKNDGFDVTITHKHGKSPHTDHFLLREIRELNILNRDSFGLLQILPDAELVEFLRGYFNGDGGISFNSKGGQIIFYVGIHERQATELQFMLWRLGIDSNIYYIPNEGGAGCWNVQITDASSILSLINLLEHTKYPHYFNKLSHRVRTGQATHTRDNLGSWRSLTICLKGRDLVYGWQTLPSHQIISTLGLKTHNSGKSLYLVRKAVEAMNKCVHCGHKKIQHQTVKIPDGTFAKGKCNAMVPSDNPNEPPHPCKCTIFKPIRVLANIHIKGAEVIGLPEFHNILTETEVKEFEDEPEFKRLANSREDSEHLCSKHVGMPCKCDPVKCPECAPHYNASIVTKFENAGFIIIHHEEIALIVIDEAWAWMDARMSGSQQNRAADVVILQSRKKGIDIAYSAQLPSSTDKRLRLNTEVAVIAKKIKKNRKVAAFRYVTASDAKCQVYRLPIEKAQEYWKFYDTRESTNRPMMFDEELNFRIRVLMEAVRKRKNRQLRDYQRRILQTQKDAIERVTTSAPQGAANLMEIKPKDYPVEDKDIPDIKPIPPEDYAEVRESVAKAKAEKADETQWQSDEENETQ